VKGGAADAENAEHMTTKPGLFSAKPRLRQQLSFLSMVLAVSVVCLLDTNGHFVLPNLPLVCAGIGLTGLVWFGAPIIGEARWLFGAVTVLLLALSAVQQKISGSDVAFVTLLWPWACLTWAIFLAAWMDFLKRCHVFKLSTVVFLLWISGVNGLVLLCRDPFALLVFNIPFGVLLVYYSTETRYGFDGFIRVAGGAYVLCFFVIHGMAAAGAIPFGVLWPENDPMHFLPLFAALGVMFSNRTFDPILCRCWTGRTHLTLMYPWTKWIMGLFDPDHLDLRMSHLLSCCSISPQKRICIAIFALNLIPRSRALKTKVVTYLRRNGYSDRDIGVCRWCGCIGVLVYDYPGWSCMTDWCHDAAVVDCLIRERRLEEKQHEKERKQKNMSRPDRIVLLPSKNTTAAPGDTHQWERNALDIPDDDIPF
jgi:hypothetical protein